MDPTAEINELKQKLVLLEQRVKELESARDPYANIFPKGAEASRIFEDLVEKIPPNSLQRVIRQTGIQPWAQAALGLPLASMLKIRNNISVGAWTIFVDYARETKRSWWPISSREEILRNVLQLEEMGEIVIGWEAPVNWGLAKRLAELDPVEIPEGDLVAGPEVDAEVATWLETVLAEAGKAPLQRPSAADRIQV